MEHDLLRQAGFVLERHTCGHQRRRGVRPDRVRRLVHKSDGDVQRLIGSPGHVIPQQCEVQGLVRADARTARAESAQYDGIGQEPRRRCHHRLPVGGGRRIRKENRAPGGCPAKVPSLHGSVTREEPRLGRCPIPGDPILGQHIVGAPIIHRTEQCKSVGRRRKGLHGSFAKAAPGRFGNGDALLRERVCLQPRCCLAIRRSTGARRPTSGALEQDRHHQDPRLQTIHAADSTAYASPGNQRLRALPV